ncbi:MAG: hypothetical protein JJE22_16320 [Bacteroidia bacterium]|nr:hypothetical protein [Bacteroidia bacterium]
MPLKWKLLGLICIVQMLISAYFSINSFITLFQVNSLFFLFQSFVFVLITWLSILTINILSNNYPDKPVSGGQKRTFNWLFLLNFLLLSFLFGLVFADYGRLKSIASLIKRSLFSLPFSLLAPLLVNLAILIFQFVILYSLYSLRRLIYRNFISKQFEFESTIAG